MRILISFFLILLLSCNSNNPATETKVAAAKDLNTVKIDNKKDPVCEMPIKGDVGDTTQYEGNVLGFCSSDCKEKFVKDPKKYIAAAEITK